MYLPASSCHSASTFRGIIKAGVWRILNRNKDQSGIDACLHNFYVRLVRRGYAYDEILKAAKQVITKIDAQRYISKYSWPKVEKRPCTRFAAIQSSTTNFKGIYNILSPLQGLVRLSISKSVQKYLQEIIQNKLERLESYRKYWAIGTTCEACASVLHVQICMLAVFLRLPSLIHPIVVI